MIQLFLECILRAVACPSKGSFFKNFFNWIDMLTITSFIINLGLVYSGIEISNYKYLLPLQFLRLFRVLKIFNIARHLRGLKILFHTLKASAKELALMLILIASLGTVFACLIYFAEQIEEHEDNHFGSIPMGFWWAIVTMTTLGYGDKVPKTVYGYVVGMFCAIFGVLFITLPVPIIVNNFSIYYSHAQAQQKLPKKKKNVLVGAADLLKQRIPDLPSNEPYSASASESSFVMEPSPLKRLSSSNSLHGGKERQQNGNPTTGIVDNNEPTKHTNTPYAYTNSNRISAGRKSLSRDSTSETIVEDFVENQQNGNEEAIDRMHKKTISEMVHKKRSSLLPGGVSHPVPGKLDC